MMRLSDGVGLNSPTHSADSLLLGVDVGTSSLKVLFLSLEGVVIDKAEAKISSDYGPGGKAEQNAMDYLQGLKKVLAKKSRLLSRVVAIGLSGQTPSLVCIDEKGEPTTPVLTWQDNRPVQEAKDLEEKFGNPMEVVGTSLPWSASACPAKLLWLSRHRPEIIRKTRWLLQPKDFIGFHLTGEAISDPWSTKGICNVESLKAITPLMKFVGWGPEKMPKLQDGYVSRGKLTPYAAFFFGFPNIGIPVSTGWSDAMSGMLSLGVFTEPSAFIFTGTSAIVGISTQTPPKDGKNLYIIPKTCAPLSVLYGPTQSSGSAISWFGQQHLLTPDEVIDEAVKSTKKSVPVFTPYLSGERAPIWRSDIRASFFGLGAEDAVCDLSRSVLEGISFGERHVLEVAMLGLGQSTSLIKLGGHAGKDPRWDVIRLRTLGTNLRRYKDEETTTRGAAMLAATLVGYSLSDAVIALQAPNSLSTPNLEQIDYSGKNYARFLLASRLTATFADSKS
ncbi:MAG: FGGY family carbohydrate kinase [Actinomycetes bacterium]